MIEDDEAMDMTLSDVTISNKQTIRLLTKQMGRLQTKLRHVDIYSHWLRQEVQRNHIQVIWTPTAEMVADGLTKPLGKGAFSMFRTAA